MSTFQLTDISHIDEAARWVLREMGPSRILLLEGDLGAGKTTLSAAICKALGITDTVSSPTFSIVQEYQSPDGPVYHMDLYRVKNTDEAFAAGIEEILFSGHRCLVEWPEKILPLLPDVYSILTIQQQGETRILDLQHHS
jgi:tRNA threonylcarbamoyladenosine biosynthesis protein TsaE